MIDNDRLKAALLVGLKPKADAADGDEPADGESHLRQCLSDMYDAIHAGDKQKFVDAGCECLLEDNDAAADE
jgi:hypothetical protein